MCKNKSSKSNKDIKYNKLFNTALSLLREVVSGQGNTISNEMVSRISNFLKEVES